MMSIQIIICYTFFYCRSIYTDKSILDLIDRGLIYTPN